MKLLIFEHFIRLIVTLLPSQYKRQRGRSSSMKRINTGGLGNDIVSIINDTSFLYLRAPIERVTGFDVPVPFFALEEHYLPTPARVVEGIEKVVHF